MTHSSLYVDDLIFDLADSKVFLFTKYSLLRIKNIILSDQDKQSFFDCLLVSPSFYCFLSEEIDYLIDVINHVCITDDFIKRIMRQLLKVICTDDSYKSRHDFKNQSKLITLILISNPDLMK